VKQRHAEPDYEIDSPPFHREKEKEEEERQEEEKRR